MSGEQWLWKELEAMIPLQDRSRADWEDALRRGGVVPRGQWPRRPMLLLLALAVALVGSVPALSLRGQIAQTIHEFLGSTEEPLNAKQLIEGVIRFPSGSKEQRYELTGIRRVISADTPEGEIRLYELIFSNGYRGSAIVGVADRAVGGASWGPPTPCPAGWALKAGGSMVGGPGPSPLYVSGRVSRATASVDVVHPDGHSSPAAVANGYFLAWVLPGQKEPTSRSSFVPPVLLVARNGRGDQIGQLSVRGDGDIPPSPGQEKQAVACG